jgi:hypothetical protein
VECVCIADNKVVGFQKRCKTRGGSSIFSHGGFLAWICRCTTRRDVWKLSTASVKFLRVSDDDSILVSEPFKEVKNDREHGALAHSPTQFQYAGDIEQELFDRDRPPYLTTNTNRTLLMEPLIGPYHEDFRYDVVYLNCKRRSGGRGGFGLMVCLDWPYGWRLHRYKIVYTDRSVLEKVMETGVERRRVQYYV